MKQLIFTAIIAMTLFTSQVNAQYVDAAEYKNRAFKFEFFSPLYGSLNFDYEQ